MTEPQPAPAFAQVWRQGVRAAVIRSVGELPTQPGRIVAHMTEIIDGHADRMRLAADVVDQVVVFAGPWSYDHTLPWLACVDPAAAAAAAEHLRSNGVRDVFVDGDLVAASMSYPPNVIRFADEALAAGWAHDPDAAAMIARLG